MWLQILLLIIGLLVGLSGHAADVKFAWDPNIETDLAGYRLYRGEQSRVYTDHVDVGNVTGYTWTVPDGSWYFAATVYNTAGLESGYSNEVQWSSAPAAIQPATNVNVSWGETSEMTVQYRNYTTTGRVDVSSSKALSVSPPSGIQENDLWVISIQVDTNSGAETIDLPSGWNQVSSQYAPAARGYPISRSIWKKAGPSESAVTITFSNGGFYSAFASSVAFYGQDLTTPIGNVSTALDGSTTAVNAPDISIVANGSIAVLFAATSGNATITRPTGTNDLGGSEGWCCSRSAYQSVDAGTYSPGNFTYSATTTYAGAAQTFEIKPAAVAAGNPHYAYAQQ